MLCDVWAAKLEAYVDGELPPETARALDEHLQACATCSAATLNKMQLRQAIHTAGHKFAPDVAFRARIQQQITTKRSGRWSWRGLPVLVGTAVLVVAVGLFSVLQRQSSKEQQLVSELADLHVATLASANPVDVVSTDRHTVKPWFEGKIPFTFNVPELQGSPFTLVGGRVSYLNQSAGAELIFRLGKHEVSLFIFQERDVEGLRGGKAVVKNSAFNARSWNGNGLSYFVIGDVSGEDLDSLSKLLRAANG